MSGGLIAGINGGKARSRLGSIALRTARDHWRFFTSSNAVPLASPYSITLLPVSQKFRVIVRQQDRGQAGEVLRLLAFEPQDFGGGEAGQHGVANLLRWRADAAQLVHDLVALRGGGGVAPQFGGPDDVALLVQGNEAVLLAADADGGDLRRRRPWRS